MAVSGHPGFSPGVLPVRGRDGAARINMRLLGKKGNLILIGHVVEMAEMLLSGQVLRLPWLRLNKSGQEEKGRRGWRRSNLKPPRHRFY